MQLDNTETKVELPPPVEYVTGDLVLADVDYIVHQTNCTTRTAAGLARQIFEAHAHADCYRSYGATSGRRPGKIDVRGNGVTRRWVVNLHGQIFGGGPRPEEGDGADDREAFFARGLHELSRHITQRHQRDVSVDFPFNIGCGLARGSWPAYKAMLETFARDVNMLHTHTVRVAVFKLPDVPDTSYDEDYALALMETKSSTPAASAVPGAGGMPSGDRDTCLTGTVDTTRWPRRDGK